MTVVKYVKTLSLTTKGKVKWISYHLVSMGYRWQKRRLEGHILQPVKGLGHNEQRLAPAETLWFFVCQSAHLIFVMMEAWHWPLPTKQVPKSHFYAPSHNVQMTWLAGRLLVYKINAAITHYIKDGRTPCHWNKKLLALGSWFLTDYHRWLVTVTVVEYPTIFPDVVGRLCMHLR